MCVCVCVSVAAGADWERSEVVNSTQGFYSLAGLQPGTHYHLKIIHDNDTHWEKFIQTIGPGRRGAESEGNWSVEPG